MRNELIQALSRIKLDTNNKKIVPYNGWNESSCRHCTGTGEQEEEEEEDKREMH